MTDQKPLQAGGALEIVDTTTVQNGSSQQDDLHKSVQQVHTIVMEEVMKKHNLHHVVVSSF